MVVESIWQSGGGGKEIIFPDGKFHLEIIFQMESWFPEGISIRNFHKEFPYCLLRAQKIQITSSSIIYLFYFKLVPDLYAFFKRFEQDCRHPFSRATALPLGKNSPWWGTPVQLVSSSKHMSKEGGMATTIISNTQHCISNYLPDWLPLPYWERVGNKEVRGEMLGQEWSRKISENMQALTRRGGRAPIISPQQQLPVPNTTTIYQ